MRRAGQLHRAGWQGLVGDLYVSPCIEASLPALSAVGHYQMARLLPGDADILVGQKDVRDKMPPSIVDRAQLHLLGYRPGCATAEVKISRGHIPPVGRHLRLE